MTMKKKIAILLVLLSCTPLTLTLMISDPVKALPDMSLGGDISICDGNTPLNGTAWEDSTNFAVWVKNSTSTPPFFKWTRYPSMGWLVTSKGRYSTVLPYEDKNINWSHGSEYRIEIDGSSWGLKNTNATSNGTGSAKTTGGGVPVPPDGTPEYTPFGNVSNYIAHWIWGSPVQTDDYQLWDVVINCNDLIPADVTVDGQGPFNTPFTDPVATVNIFQGETVTLSSSVRNVGTTFVNRTSTILFWNKTGGVLDWNVTGHTLPVPALGTEVPVPNQATWPGTSMVGTYSLYITVDYPTEFTEYNTISGFSPDYGNITEVDDTDIDVYPSTNNTVRIRVIVAPLPRADLIPGDFPLPTNIEFDGIPVTGASGTPPVSDKIGVGASTVHSISSIVANVGPAGPAVDFNVSFYNCTSDGAILDPPFLDMEPGPLNSGASSPPLVENWVAPATHSTDAFICIEVDSNGEVEEENEDNNTYIIHVSTLEPPRVFNVLIDDATSATYSICALPSSIELKATIDDEFTDGSNISGANYTLGAANWPSSTNMDPSDGSFDSMTENVIASVDIGGWGPGTYNFYVYGWDEIPNYNTTSAAFATLEIVDDCSPSVDEVLINGLPSLTVTMGGGPVVVTSILNDSLMGNNNITSANYTIGAQAWPGVAMSAVMMPFDNPVEEVTSGTIDISGWNPGSYSFCVYGSDEEGNGNVTGMCASLSIDPERIPPEIKQVYLNGASSHTEYLSSLPASVTLTAIVDDSNTGGSFIGTTALGGANYTNGLYNWESGQPMHSQDGTWGDDAIESVTADISVLLSPGIYSICVHGWDRWLNYNTTGACAQLTIIDDVPPKIISVESDSDSYEAGAEVTISVEILDYYTDPNIQNVTVEIFGPDGSSIGNFSMNYDPIAGKFMYISTFDLGGTYIFTVWASDLSQNWNRSSSVFVIKGAPQPRGFLQDWWWVIPLVAAVVMVMLIGLLFVKKRGRKDQNLAEPGQEQRIGN
jgi:hypothetical protein